MPLIKVPKNASKKTKNRIIGQNIKELRESGRSQKRAVEIAAAAGNKPPKNTTARKVMKKKPTKRARR